jgi:hypothetical protein
MNFNAIYEMWYWLFNVSYYKVTIVKDMEKIKTLIQKVASTEKGKDIAIIDKSLKRAWWIMPEVCFRDGKKFLMMCDIDNAVPLVEDIKIITTGNRFLKEITITRLRRAGVKAGEEKTTGKPIRFVGAEFPPTLLFEKTAAFFVKETIKPAPNAWEEKKWIFISAFIALVVLGYLVLQSGILQQMNGA